MSNDKIRVLIADDHAIVRMGLRALLEPEHDLMVVGEAEDGIAAVAACETLSPDIIIMDIMMPGRDGIDATKLIRQINQTVRILILTTTSSSDDIASSLAAGANGALLKSTQNSKLVDAIRRLHKGETVISPDIQRLMSDDPPTPELTNRQTQILQAITKGLTNADISRILELHEDSVKEHIIAIYKKLGATNRAEAAAIAVRKHLLKM